MKTTRVSIFVAACVALAVALGAYAAEKGTGKERKGGKGKAKAAASVQVPSAVASAVQAASPGAKIDKATLEEGLYDVEATTADGKHIEFEIAPTGQLMEIEQPATESDLPPAAAETAKAVLASGKSLEMAKKAITVYAVEKLVGDLECKVVVDPNGKVLSVRARKAEKEEQGEEGLAAEKIPPAVLKAFQSALPGAKMDKAKPEEGIFEIEATCADGKKAEIEVTPQGDLQETEQEIAESALPPAVSENVAAVVPGGKTTETEKAVSTVYAIEKMVNDVKYEILVAPDGNVVSITAEKAAKAENAAEGEIGEKQGEGEEAGEE